MMTERVGLFGWPVEHSISPAMHNAAFAALGLDWSYDLLPVLPQNFEDEVIRLVDAGYRGFNVTIPHKQAALELLLIGETTPAARAIGAANTLIAGPDNGLLRADNTDARGFAGDLQQHGITIEGTHCLVLGTGGSARAVTFALAQNGAASVIRVSRRPTGQPGIIGYGDLAHMAPAMDIVINCTPAGMSPRVDESPWPDGVPFPAGAVLYDLIYNPPVTRLMETARSAGARAINGLGMLVMQGAYAFQTWTGIMPPVDVMTNAARQALGLED
ncbi:MAG: shikimate dehydrogenase [Anaerolineae bacterium]|nr:shikimate dehydrogenase [Anaerolineae bacterium]